MSASPQQATPVRFERLAASVSVSAEVRFCPLFHLNESREAAVRMMKEGA